MMRKVAFIQNITEELFGYMHMSSVLKRNGHDCAVFVHNFEKDILRALQIYRPDILGFSCVTGNLQWGVEIFKEYKKYDSRCLTILGGPHPTFFPSVILQGNIDALSMGESEEAILEICQKYDGELDSIRDLRNLCTARDGQMKVNPLRPLIDPLDPLGAPDRSLYKKYTYFQNLDSLPVMASRGCPFSCTFCYSYRSRTLYHNLGKFVRFRSPENMAAELEGLRENSPKLRYFIFNDSTFNANPQWLLDFLRIYQDRIRLPFFCSIRADIATQEQIDALARANCRVICMGIEGGSYRLRKDILHRDMSDEVMIKTADRIREAGILLSTTNIFALPTETLDESYGLILINRKIKADVIASTVFQPYPGTELERIAQAAGLLRNFEFDDIHNYYYASLLRQKDVGAQIRLQKIAFYLIRYPRFEFFWKFLARRAPFAVLYALFLISLTINVKKAYGYSWWNIMRYGLTNFGLFSSK